MRNRLFSPEYVKSLSEPEKWRVYEQVKQTLIERNADQNEYENIVGLAIEELGL